MSMRSNEGMPMDAEQYAMQQQHQQQQPPIQYVSDENIQQGNQQCAAQMVPMQDHTSAMDHQYTNEMIPMNDMNQQQLLQHHTVMQHDDPSASQNLLTSNDIRMQPTICKLLCIPFKKIHHFDRLFSSFIRSK